MGITIYNASAGSGKTHLLTNLIAKLISGDVDGIEKVNPSKIIATTFTTAAAKEIRERATEVLIDKGLIEDSFKLKEGVLGTVNSLCGSLIEKYSMFTNLSSETRVIDEDERDLLLNSIIGHELTSGLITKSRNIGWTIDSHSKKDRLVENLKRAIDLIRYNKLEIRESEIEELVFKILDNNYQNSKSSSETLDEFKKRINSFFETLYEEGKCFVATGGRGAKGVNDIYVKGLEKDFFSNNNSNSLSYILNLLKTLTKKAKTFRSDFEAKTGLSFELLIEDLIYSKYRRNELKDFFEDFIKVCLSILGSYQNSKREEGLIDFADQEYLFLDLLENEFVCKDISCSYEVLLVDEFQDTSPIQFLIFNKLNQLINHTIWIGDPKQSIYGFRGADSDLMNEIVNYVNSNNEVQGVLKQEKNQLNTSYRSREELVEFSNEIFSESFSSLESEHIKLLPLRDRLTNSSSSEIIIWKQGPSSKRTISSNALAVKIKEVLEGKSIEFYPKGKNKKRSLIPGDVCFITRSNRAVLEVAKELSTIGLKVNAPVEGLINQPEVFVIIAALKLIRDPKDKLSMLEILSCSTFFGDVAQAINYTLSKEDFSNEFLSKIKVISKEARKLPVLNQIELIITATHFKDRLKGMPNEFQAILNINELQKHAKSYQSFCENNGFVSSAYGFEQYLNSRNPSQGFKLNKDCVNVMTYHASKGLEFPMVVLCELHKPIKPSFGIHVSSSTSLDFNNPLDNRFLDIKLDDDLLKENVLNTITKKETEENKRLMYVGVTRARDFVVIPFIDKDNGTNAEINLLSDATNNKINYCDLSALEYGDGSLKIGQKRFKVSCSDLIEKSLNGVAPDQKYIDKSDYVFENSGLVRKVLPSGKGIMHTELKFKDFKTHELSKSIDFDFTKLKLSKNDFGNVIHAVYQQITLNSISNAEKILENWGVHSLKNEIDVFKSTFDELLNWVGVEFSAVVDVFSEQPFSFYFDKRVMEGVIDLMVKTEDGWVIIDYKTHFDPLTDLTKHSKQNGYFKQLNNYSEALNDYDGLPVLGGVLYFPFLSKLVFSKG